MIASHAGDRLDDARSHFGETRQFLSDLLAVPKLAAKRLDLGRNDFCAFALLEWMTTEYFGVCRRRRFVVEHYEIEDCEAAFSVESIALLVTGNRDFCHVLADFNSRLSGFCDELKTVCTRSQSVCNRSSPASLALKTHPSAGCFWHVTRCVPTPSVLISCCCSFSEMIVSSFMSFDATIVSFSTQLSAS